jgi:hypothetical protein
MREVVEQPDRRTGSTAEHFSLRGAARKEDRVLASEVEIGDHVTIRGEEWEVTDVTDRRGGEEIQLELTRWTIERKHLADDGRIDVAEPRLQLGQGLAGLPAGDDVGADGLGQVLDLRDAGGLRSLGLLDDGCGHAASSLLAGSSRTGRVDSIPHSYQCIPNRADRHDESPAREGRLDHGGGLPGR